MYAGVDFDTKAIHIVLLPEEGPAQYLPCVMHGHDAFERTRVVRDVMPARGWWEDQGVIALGIEEPMGRGSVVQKLNVVQGAVLACLPTYLLVYPMRPSVWRTKVDLAGNSSKEDVARFGLLVRRFGSRILEMNQSLVTPFDLEAWPQDAYDAICMALAVQKLTEPVAA